MMYKNYECIKKINVLRKSKIRLGIAFNMIIIVINLKHSQICLMYLQIYII